jgi:hypothetical protein
MCDQAAETLDHIMLGCALVVKFAEKGQGYISSSDDIASIDCKPGKRNFTGYVNKQEITEISLSEQ